MHSQPYRYSQALALRGAAVALTDAAVMLPLLRENVAANFGAGQPASGMPGPPLVRLALLFVICGNSLDKCLDRQEKNGNQRCTSWHGAPA